MTSFDDGWECPFPWKIPSFRHFTLEKKKPTEKPTKTQKDFGGNILIGGTWRCKLGRIQTSTGHRWVLISSLDLALSWNFLSTTSLEHGNSPAALSMLSCTKPVQNLYKTCAKPVQNPAAGTPCSTKESTLELDGERLLRLAEEMFSLQREMERALPS